MLDRRFPATFAALGLALTAVAAGAAGKDAPQARPELLQRLVDCRAIAEPTARLNCYDTQVGAIDAAEKQQDLVVMDRAQIRETRKSLFGFTLPSFSLGGKKLDEKDDITEINTKVAAVRHVASGWIITLADDAGTWQSDDLTSAPSVGDKVRIRKAMMGSYLGKVGFSQGARFRRIN